MKLSRTFQFVFGAVSLIAFRVICVDACKCAVQSPKISFCNADWVSHVRINVRQSSVPMPPQIKHRQMPSNTKFDVQHVKVFKSPTNGVLANIVYTPQENGACGILLEQGHEYLLAGRIVDGTLLAYICGQILLDDPIESRRHDILEWAEVSPTLRKQLETGEMGKKCEY